MKKFFLLSLCALAVAARADLESEAAYKMNEQQLLAIVKAGALTDRVTACQELTHRGTAASVPVLAAFLTDAAAEPLFHAALYGLQNIPGHEVDAALAAAMAKTTGARAASLRHALAVRTNPALEGYAGADEALTAFPKMPTLADVNAAQATYFAAARGTDAAAAAARRLLIGVTGSPAETQVLEEALLKVVETAPDAKAARFAFEILGERRARGVLPGLVALAKTTPDEGRRDGIFRTLAGLCEAREDLPQLVELLARFPEEERLAGAIIRVLSRAFAPEMKPVKVIEAKFGNFEQKQAADVKLMVDALVAAGSREIMAGCRLVGRGGFHSDPARGLKKELRIAYTLGNGPVCRAIVPENEMLSFGELVLEKDVARQLIDAWAKAEGPSRTALRRIIAALARRGTVPGSDAVLFRALGNAKDLAGWKQEGDFFSMRDGVLTAESTPAHPCKQSRYLIYAKEQFADFELRGEFRLSASANSGIQLRSTDALLVDSGYQADMDGSGNIVGYIFHTRQHLVGERGADVALAANGAKKVVPFADGKELRKVYRPGEWNDIRIVVKGRAIATWINGVRTAAVIDAREDFLPQKGYISIQMHQGKPMKIEFRNLRVRTDEVALGGNLEAALEKELEEAEYGAAPAFDGSAWIWHPAGQKDHAKVAFRARLDLPEGEIERAGLVFSCDDSAVFSVNGKVVGEQTGGKLWYTPTAVCDLARTNLKPGRNLIEVAAENNTSQAGFLAMVEVVYKDGRIVRFPTSPRGWEASLDGKAFVKPAQIVEYGGKPYGTFPH